MKPGPGSGGVVGVFGQKGDVGSRQCWLGAGVDLHGGGDGEAPAEGRGREERAAGEERGGGGGGGAGAGRGGEELDALGGEELRERERVRGH